MDEKLKKLHDIAINIIRDQYKGEDASFQMIPIMFAQNEKSDLNVVALVGYPEDYRRNAPRSYEKLSARMKEMGFVRYSFASEAWVAACQPGDMRAPSEHDDRREVVMLFTCDGVDTIMTNIRIERDESGAPSLGQEDDLSGTTSMTGPMMTLLSEKIEYVQR
jgi:hypothetical protein